MTIYSHSRLNDFEQCPLKYKYKYIDKIKTKEISIEAFLGKIVHNALEWLYKQIKQEKTPTIDDIIMFYTKNWQEKFKPEITKITRDLKPEDYFNKGVEFLINYYTKHQPFDDNTIETEKRIFIKLNEEHKIIGYIDRLVNKKGTYEIHDYKTANNLPHQETIDKDRQLALYSIAIREEFQTKRIKLIWHYLAHNKTIYSTRTNEQLEQLKKDILNLIKTIESTKEFSPNKSVLCNWCEYKKYCPEFGNQPPEKQEQQTNLKGFPTVEKYLREQ